MLVHPAYDVKFYVTDVVIIKTLKYFKMLK